MKQIAALPLYETQDYKILKTVTGNRAPNEVQIKRLARIIRENGNITKVSPLIVNEKFQIIDGQHRLWAMELIEKETKVKNPIYFIVREGLTAEDAMKLNSGSKPWNPDDYAQYHKKNGNKNYAIFLSFRDRFGLNAEVLMKYLSPGTGSRIEFQNGEFVVWDEEKTNQWCKKLEEMEPFYRDFKHRSFALAYLTLVSHKDYSHQRMLEQAEEYAAKEFLRVPLKNKPMRAALIEIYNKRNADKKLFN